MKPFLKSQSLAVFIFLAFAISWACWIPILDSLQADAFASPAHALALLLLGGYGPSLAAILCTLLIGEKGTTKALFKRLIQWRVDGFWYLVVFLAGPLLYTVATAIYVATGAELGAVNIGLLPWIPVLVIVSLFFGPMAEELGWRGYALPRMIDKLGVTGSALALGLVWAAWHAPLFWAATGTAISGLPLSASSISLFVLGVTGSAFIYSWMFKPSGGSVFMAVLLHLSMNASGAVCGMLFPEMNAEQKFTFYQAYVAGVWILLAVAGTIHTLRKARLKPLKIKT